MSLSGGLCPEGLCTGGSVKGISIQRVSVQRRGSLSMGSLSMRVSVQGGPMSRGGVSVHRDLYPVGSVHGLSVWGFLSRRVSIYQSLSLVSMFRGGDLCPGWGLIPESLSKEVCPWGLW